jgi:hypothetical protein
MLQYIFTLLTALSLFPTLVFCLSWGITLGHWENSLYRKPALFSFCFSLICGAGAIFTGPYL